MKRNIAAIITILFLTACALPETGKTPELEDISPEPVESVEIIVDNKPEEPVFIPTAGGSVRIDCRNPKTFNPILNEDLSVDRLLRLIYEPLIALDETMKPAPALASSWDFSPDGLTLTLHIRQNARWEDGEEITAEDVAYTIDAIRESPETSLYRLCAANILDYSAPDEKTLRINYEKPFGGALYNLTFPVIPKHHFFVGRTGEEVTEPLGSGLYKLAEFSTMRDVRLTASESCYKGRANITEVVAVIMRDLGSSLYAYDQNIIDIVETKRADWKKISTTRQSQVYMSASNGYEFLALNFRNTALNDKNMRKAIAHAIPKEEMIEKTYAGNAFSTDTPINPQSWLYEPNVATYEYDPEKAREYLRNSSYSSYEGESLKILVNSENPERVAAAERIRFELESIGIACEVENREFDDYNYRLFAGYFDIALCGFDMSVNPDFSTFLGGIGGVMHQNNFIAYQDDEMDSYLLQADIAVFEVAQRAAYSNIQKRFADELPYISLFYKANIVLAGTDIYGEVHPVVNNAYNNLGEVYIKH